MAEGGTFSQKVAELTTRVALLEAGANQLAENIRKLSVTIDGNGTTSGLGARVSTLEFTLVRIEAEIQSIKNRIAEHLEEKKTADKEDEDRRKKRGDSLQVAVIMLIFSTIVSIGLTLLNLR